MFAFPRADSVRGHGRGELRLHGCDGSGVYDYASQCSPGELVPGA